MKERLKAKISIIHKDKINTKYLKIKNIGRPVTVKHLALHEIFDSIADFIDRTEKKYKVRIKYNVDEIKPI